MAAEVKITLLGDASDLNKELEKVEGALEEVDSAAKNTGDGIGGMGDKADASEQRIMGLRDMIDGTAAIMKGPGEEGISAYLQGWADMASGIANFAAPALMALKGNIITTAKTAVTSAATHIASVGRQIAAWVLLGAQSLLHAAKVAAAWLIAMGPIAIVIAAVIGLVALIIANWDKIKVAIAAAWNWIKDKTAAFWNWVKDAVKAAVDFLVGLFKNFTLPGLIMKHWDKIKEGVSNVIGWIKDRWNDLVSWFRELPGRIGRAVGGLFDGLKSAFRNAINWIIDKWNNFKISIQLPTILGGGRIDINTPNIPRFHTGGVFRAPAGQSEGLALLHNRETILPPGVKPNIHVTGAPMKSVPTIIIESGAIVIHALDPTQSARAVVEALQLYQRGNGAIPISVAGVRR